MIDIESILGQTDHLTAFQMAVRSFFMFFITLLLMRLGGLRIFGGRSALDNIILIIMGSVIARGIVGANSVVSTVAASAVMIMLHRILSRLSVYIEWLRKLVNGDHIILYKSDHILWDNMRKSSISESELMESLHLETKKTSLEEIETATLETNGRISFILKTKKAE
jgi:uncharacterized membrane protein YcaP (DUF421 family)